MADTDKDQLVIGASTLKQTHKANMVVAIHHTIDDSLNNRIVKHILVCHGMERGIILIINRCNVLLSVTSIHLSNR